MLKKMTKRVAGFMGGALRRVRLRKGGPQALSVRISRNAIYITPPVSAGGGLFVLPHPARAAQPIGFKVEPMAIAGGERDYRLHAGELLIATYRGAAAERDSVSAVALIEAALTRSPIKTWGLRVVGVVCVWLAVSALVAVGRQDVRAASVDFAPSTGNSPMQDLPSANVTSPDAAFQAVTQGASKTDPGLSASLYNQALEAARKQGAPVPGDVASGDLAGFGLGASATVVAAAPEQTTQGCDPALAFKVPDGARASAAPGKSKLTK
ncbi:hypothetical protein [Burkholderia multivorans]|uniref:hypothetical protein n=1 Tax=Burkholderia multivorans TaxID=87883 RepID=UPI00158BF70A|nr:hypothetical protein [Burkholderia multivorans]MDR8877440.1 hypothetical protein [Burkholderia multivorans]MDR8883940.1 hypothetical protein [Burkholderia multivorans]MDR8890311.1 hypothetical protein [Burkholderia multivorans]MDR8909127.1 hypothetical protein [Burkholderia multivorans]MDR8914680.1 hypothetical protein [Burkholderia multivorans]